MIFQRLWRESGIQDSLIRLLIGRKFEFNVERAIFLTVLHRLMVSGSDRHCERWRRDYLIPGTEDLDLHHLYRAMSFLGECISDEDQGDELGPRRNKDLIEEMMFNRNRHLFSELELVFFDTFPMFRA